MTFTTKSTDAGEFTFTLSPASLAQAAQDYGYTDTDEFVSVIDGEAAWELYDKYGRKEESAWICLGRTKTGLQLPRCGRMLMVTSVGS